LRVAAAAVPERRRRWYRPRAVPDPSPSWQQIGEQLRQLREESGISLRALALEGDLSKTAIHRIERGERVPSADTLWDLALMLNVRFTIGPEGVQVKPLGRRRKRAA
jgi:transcriptional regulator with XRE-family HTH domain